MAGTSKRIRKAFTLVESLVVLAIMSILAAMALPQMTGTGEMAAQAAARRIMADVEYAQNQAIVTQTNVTVAFSISGNSYGISNASGYLQNPITKKDFVVDFDTLAGSSGVTISTVNLTNSQVTFDSLGSPASDGNVTVMCRSQGYKVTIAPVSGRVKVDSVP